MFPSSLNFVPERQHEEWIATSDRASRSLAREVYALICGSRFPLIHFELDSGQLPVNKDVKENLADSDANPNPRFWINGSNPQPHDHHADIV